MFEVGDLVYLKDQSIDSNMWWSLRDLPCIILNIGPVPRVITIQIYDQQVKVFPEWIEKRTMEDICTK